MSSGSSGHRLTFDKLFFFYLLCTLAGVFPRAVGELAGTAGGEETALHSAGSNPVLLLFNAIAVVLTALRSFRLLPTMFDLLGRARALTIIYALVALSPLWATQWGVSFRAAVYVVVYLFAAMYFALTMDTEDIYELLGNSAAVLALMSIFGQYFFPPSNDLAPGWSGVFFQKNELGIMMTIGILAHIVQPRRWTILRVAECLLCGALLLLSQSVTSLGCLVIAAGSLFFLRLTRKMRLMMLAIVWCLLVVVVVFLPNAPALILALNGRDSSFTGRDIIWAYALRSILAHPFLGYGYQDFWNEVAGTTGLAFGFTPSNSENGILQIALSTGLPGLIASGFFVVNSWKLSTRARSFRESLPGVGLFALNVVLLVRSISEPAFVEQNLLWFALMLAYMSATLVEQRAEQQPSPQPLAAQLQVA